MPNNTRYEATFIGREIGNPHKRVIMASVVAPDEARARRILCQTYGEVKNLSLVETYSIKRLLEQGGF